MPMSMSIMLFCCLVSTEGNIENRDYDGNAYNVCIRRINLTSEFTREQEGEREREIDKEKSKWAYIWILRISLFSMLPYSNTIRRALHWLCTWCGPFSSILFHFFFVFNQFCKTETLWCGELYRWKWKYQPVRKNKIK